MAERRQELLDLLGEVSGGEGALAVIFAELPDDSPVLKIRYANRDALIEALAWERDKIRRAGGAGAGATTAAGRTASPRYTAFFEALQHAELRPVGNGMALLSCRSGVPFISDMVLRRGALLVRDFYPDLLRLMTTGQAWLLTGVPGTGKSWFALYAMYALLQQPKPPAIVWQTTRRLGGCVLFKDGKAFTGGLEAFAQELQDPSTWYFCEDMMALSEDVEARTVMVCAPKRSVYKEWLKVAGVKQLTMPLWTWEEIEECWRQLYQDKVPLDRVKKNFDLWYGGVPRLVLEQPALQDASVDKQAAISAISATNVSQVIAACSGAYDRCPETSHRVIHEDGDRTTFSQAGYRFATRHIASLFMQQVSERGELAQTVRRLLASASCDPGLLGQMFEGYAQALLVQGGGGKPFEFRYLDSPGGAAAELAQAAQPLQLQLTDFKEEVSFHAGSRSGGRTNITGFCEAAQQLQLSGAQSAYLRPSGHGHPLVDSCIYPDTLLRISVAEGQDKVPVDEDLLEAHLACLPDRPQYFLDYVVPPQVYSAFKIPKLQRDSSHARVQKAWVRVVQVPWCMAAATSPQLQSSKAKLRPAVLPSRSGAAASRCRIVV